MGKRFELLALICLTIAIALLPILALAQADEAPHDKVKLD